MLVISHSQVKRILRRADCPGAVEVALGLYSKGRATAAPNRIYSRFGPGKAWMFAVAGAITPSDRMVLKALPVNRENPKSGLPHMYGVILLCRLSTGTPLAIMDGTHITNVRTGAMAGIGAKHLARKNSRVLAVIGSGEIAWHGTLSVAKTFPSLESVVVYSRTHTNRERFAREMGKLINAEVRPAGSVRVATRDSDIIVTATSAVSPVLRKEHLGHGAFIAALGSPREVEPSVLSKVKVVAETEECNLYGKIGEALKRGLIRDRDVVAELGDIVSGRARGRTSDGESFLLDCIGLAVEDVALASIVYDRARRLGIGTKVQMYEGLR